MKKAFKIIIALIVILLIAVAAMVIVSTFPIFGENQILVVQSGSMSPTIKIGSVVFISPAEEYLTGDIITFKDSFRGKVPITHRIDSVIQENNQRSYATKGDANDDVDTRLITEKQIIGKVRFHVPYIGYLLATAKTPYGFLAIIILPAVLVIAGEIKKIIKALKARKQADEKPEEKN